MWIIACHCHNLTKCPSRWALAPSALCSLGPFHLLLMWTIHSYTQPLWGISKHASCSLIKPQAEIFIHKTCPAPNQCTSTQLHWTHLEHVTWVAYKTKKLQNITGLLLSKQKYIIFKNENILIMDWCWLYRRSKLKCLSHYFIRLVS